MKQRTVRVTSLRSALEVGLEYVLVCFLLLSRMRCLCLLAMNKDRESIELFIEGVALVQVAKDCVVWGREEKG
jgi:hypothetical protein